MSNVGMLARIICAIFDVVLSIGLSIQCINDGDIGLVPLFVVIASGMLMWLFDFMRPGNSTDWTLIEDQGSIKIYRKLFESGKVVYKQEYTKEADNNVNKAKAGKKKQR